MIKKIFFLLMFLIPFSLFALEPFKYSKLEKVAKEVNIKLFNKYKKVSIPKEDENISKKKNTAIVETINNLQKNTNINIKKDKSDTGLIIIKSPKKDKLRIFRLPYLKEKDVIIEVIGTKKEYLLCKAKLKGQIILESCKDVIGFIKERNELLDEFLKNFLKFKKEFHANSLYYRGEFNCGFLYKYYGFEKYPDCERLFSMLSEKEKKELMDYVQFMLNK